MRPSGVPLSAAVQGELRHDLRTPFNGILGYSDMLLETAAEDGHEVLVPGLKELVSAARDLLASINAELAPEREVHPTALDALGRSVLAQAIELDRQSESLLALARDRSPDALGDLAKIHAAIVQLSRLAQQRLLDAPSVVAETPQTGTPEERGEFAPLPARQLSGIALVVDDNEINRDLLTRRLEREGCGSAQAAGGAEALELLAKGGFDVVLLDVLMPGLDGYEVLRRIKATPALRDLPVIMISSLDEMSSVVRCIEMGAEDYLPKPFDPVLLRARVGASLEKKHHRDRELDYLRCVASIAEAAAAVETRTFEAESLDTIAARTDELGQLARVMQRAAVQLKAREQKLQQEVAQLRIEIDLVRVGQQVSEVTGGDLYSSLKDARKRLEERRRKKAEP